MKRYQIITYSVDSGSDEKQEYTTQARAASASRKYRQDKYYDGVMIFDLWRKHIVKTWGNWPANACPKVEAII